MADNSSKDQEGVDQERAPSGIYLSDILGMLRRRWYVLVIGLLLVVGGVGAAYLKTPTSYQATGQLLLLLPPQATGSDGPTNPYLNLHPGLNTAAVLIASTMNTPELQRSVAEAGHTAEYDIALNPESGPLLVITTESADPQQAIGTRNEVIARLQAELERMQTEEDAPKRQFIHTRTNGTFDEAEMLTGDRIRAVAAVGGGGLLLILLVVVVWDRVASRLGARIKSRRGEAAVPEPVEALPEPVEGPEPVVGRDTEQRPGSAREVEQTARAGRN